MPVVSLALEVHLAGCGSAKQRAARVEEMLKKLKKHFNVSVADLSRADEFALAVLGFSSMGRTKREAREVLERVADAVSAHPTAEIQKAVFDEM